MDVEITNRRRLRTATLRHIGRYNRISEAFGRLAAAAPRIWPAVTMLILGIGGVIVFLGMFFVMLRHMH